MRLVIVGACGRMGEAIARLAIAREDIEIVGAVDAAGVGQSLGQQIGVSAIDIPALDIRITPDLAAVLPGADVVVDFSSPRATLSYLSQCARQKVAVVVGTTGHDADFDAAVAPLAKEIPILIAANTSLGVTLLTELVRAAARALPADFDIEIHEAHHRHKLDAPSGTALKLGRAAAEGRGKSLEQLRVDPHLTGLPRPPGAIGFAVTRGGDIVGEHEVRFAGMGESLTLSHHASDRVIFARGALQAASWLSGQAPGRYDMTDVLGIKSV